MDINNHGIAALVEYFKEKIEYTYLNKKKIFFRTLGEDISAIDKKLQQFRSRPKIVFFFGAGASQPAGGWLSAANVNQVALEALGSLDNLKKFMTAEDLRQIGLTPDDLDMPDNLVFEQIMSLLRKYYGQWPECAEVLLFQRIFPREKLLDFNRDAVPIPFIYEITAHMVKYGLIDHVITTNFDELIDRALNEELGKKGYIRVHHLSKFESVCMDHAYREKPCLIKVHGTISYSLTLRQLVDNVVELERHKIKLLENILKDAVVVDIGCSFYNPNLQKFFYRLKMKNILRDFFVIKRGVATASKFIEFILKNESENLILMDCEDFAKELTSKIESESIDISEKHNNSSIYIKPAGNLPPEKPSSNNTDLEENNSKEDITDFFPDFSRHRLRNTFFKQLRLYPCAASTYLIEFIATLFKSRGLVTDQNLHECNNIIRAIKYRPYHIQSMISEIDRVNRKIKKLGNCDIWKDKCENAEHADNQGKNYRNIINSLKEWFKKDEHIRNDKDTIIQILNFLIDPTVNNLNNPNKEDSTKQSITENSTLNYKLTSLIERLEGIRVKILEDININPRFSNDLLNKTNNIIVSLYKIYKDQLCKLLEIETKDVDFLVKKVIDNKSIITINRQKLYENNCSIKDKIPYHNSNFFKNIYCLLVDSDKEIEDIEKKVLDQLISILLKEKILQFDSAIISIINYFNQPEEIRDKVKDHLIKDIEIAKTKLFSNLTTNFDITIRPDKNMLPILPTPKYFSNDLELNCNNDHDQDKDINRDKKDIIFFVESKLELEIINKYILDKAHELKDDETFKVFICSETGEWITKKSGWNDLEPSIFTSQYKCIEENFSGNRENNQKIYHLSRFSQNVESHPIPCCTNDLRGTIVCSDKFWFGILFNRPMKSTIISPVFFKIASPATKDEDDNNFGTSIRDFVSWLKERSSKSASSITGTY